MKISTECFTDTYLIERLLEKSGYSEDLVVHSRKKLGVLRKVSGFGHYVGMIDEDPGSIQSSDLENYETIRREDSMKLLRRIGDETKKIIVICPVLEIFLFEAADTCGINPGIYGFIPDPFHVHDNVHILHDKGYQDFINDLIERSDMMEILRQWLLEIMNLK